MDSEQIRSALERVVASPGFAGAGRLGPFLRYLVRRTLADGGAGLKESVIGVEVFGRPADYDPRTDPIVRVEARRLRSRLADYYGGPGAADSVRIDLPKGGYIPTFSASTPATGAPRRAWGHLFELALAAGAAVTLLLVWLLRPPGAPVAPSVAVLPFANLSGQAENEYFSDGLTEELIDALGRVPGLRTAARGSVFQFKDRPVDTREAGRRLNVAHVVEGSVRRAGSRLRVTAQLVGVRDGYSLWSETWDREVQDVFAIQEEIARAIVNALRLHLRAPAAEPLARRYTERIDAYNLYLQGRYQWNRYSEEGMRRAVAALQEALKIDPAYAPAWALLSSTYAMQGYYQLEPHARVMAEARAAAERAIAIDPSLAEAHASRGFVLALSDWKWSAAEEEFRTALRLNPSSGDVHSAYAIACLLPQARLADADAEFRKALELDPVSVFTNFAAALSLLSSGRTDDAVRQYRRTLELNSTTPDMWWDLGMALAYSGRREEALAAWRKRAELERRPSDEPGPMENALLGNAALAREQLARWEKIPGRRDVNEPMDLVRVYATLGDRDKAFAWLDRAIARPDPEVVWLKVDPRLAGIRQDARFPAEARRLGL